MKYDPTILIHYLGNKNLQARQLQILFNLITDKNLSVRDSLTLMIDCGYTESASKHKGFDYSKSMNHFNSTQVLYDEKLIITNPNVKKTVHLNQSEVKPEHFEFFCWLMFNHCRRFLSEDMLVRFPEMGNRIKIGRLCSQWGLQNKQLSVWMGGRKWVTKWLVTTLRDDPILFLNANAANRLYKKEKQAITDRLIF